MNCQTDDVQDTASVIYLEIRKLVFVNPRDLSPMYRQGLPASVTPERGEPCYYAKAVAPPRGCL